MLDNKTRQEEGQDNEGSDDDVLIQEGNSAPPTFPVDPSRNPLTGYSFPKKTFQKLDKAGESFARVKDSPYLLIARKDSQKKKRWFLVDPNVVVGKGASASVHAAYPIEENGSVNTTQYYALKKFHSVPFLVFNRHPTLAPSKETMSPEENKYSYVLCVTQGKFRLYRKNQAGEFEAVEFSRELIEQYPEYGRLKTVLINAVRAHKDGKFDAATKNKINLAMLAAFVRVDIDKEANMMAKKVSPYTFGPGEFGDTNLVQEYLGEPLTVRSTKNAGSDASRVLHPEIAKLSFEERVKLIYALFHRINMLHHHTPSTGRAIFHGDIKTRNIVFRIEKDDKTGEKRIHVSLVDFGHARFIEGASDPNFMVPVRAGNGTKKYSAPEVGYKKVNYLKPKENIPDKIPFGEFFVRSSRSGHTLKVFWSDNNGKVTHKKITTDIFLGDLSNPADALVAYNSFWDLSMKENPNKKEMECLIEAFTSIGCGLPAQGGIKNDIYSLGLVIEKVLKGVKVPEEFKGEYEELITLKNKMKSNDYRNRPSTDETFQEGHAIYREVQEKEDKKRIIELIKKNHAVFNQYQGNSDGIREIAEEWEKLLPKDLNDLKKMSYRAVSALHKKLDVIAENIATQRNSGAQKWFSRSSIFGAGRGDKEQKIYDYLSGKLKYNPFSKSTIHVIPLLPKDLKNYDNSYILCGELLYRIESEKVVEKIRICDLKGFLEEFQGAIDALRKDPKRALKIETFSEKLKDLIAKDQALTEFYVMQAIPDKEDLKDYNNSYILVKNDLYYIEDDKICFEYKIKDRKAFLDKIHPDAAGREGEFKLTDTVGIGKFEGLIEDKNNKPVDKKAEIPRGAGHSMTEGSDKDPGNKKDADDKSDSEGSILTMSLTSNEK
jgi:hypothetical protein